MSFADVHNDGSKHFLLLHTIKIHNSNNKIHNFHTLHFYTSPKMLCGSVVTVHCLLCIWPYQFFVQSSFYIYMAAIEQKKVAIVSRTHILYKNLFDMLIGIF